MCSEAGSDEPITRDTIAWISDKVGVHEERCSAAGAEDCLPGTAPGGLLVGAPGPVGGACPPGVLGTAVGGACSGGVGRLLAGILSSSGGLAPMGLVAAASLLSEGCPPAAFG